MDLWQPIPHSCTCAEEAFAAERIPRYSHETYPDRAGVDIARRLQIPTGEDVMRTDYVSYGNDEPMMLTHSYEPLAITKGTVIERPEEGIHMTAGLIPGSPLSTCDRRA
jgi:GntR family transcriptional regulator